MRIKKLDHIQNIVLPSINGENFDTSILKGKKYLLTFYRFASCPMCSLRINEMTNRYDELGDDFAVVGIFHSEISNLKRFMKRHDSPFIMLADKDFKYFSKYDIQRSFVRFISTFILRAPRFLRATFKLYISPIIKGHMDIMPVDILVDEKGKVQDVKYGKDIGDHISIEEIIKFSHS